MLKFLNHFIYWTTRQDYKSTSALLVCLGELYLTVRFGLFPITKSFIDNNISIFWISGAVCFEVIIIVYMSVLILKAFEYLGGRWRL
jgi:hypothetical protein